ncbi:CHRD domain-containing protein [Streptomyces sp. P9(2023)]|nr:CHRD domain-containing protein [Streptomyces sp. P9(2023)]
MVGRKCPGRATRTVVASSSSRSRVTHSATSSACVTFAPTSAHIHIAPKGEAGPVVVTLKTPPENGSVSDCIRAQKKQNPENAATVLTFWELKGIKEDLFLFYTNVHNQEFPAGDVRGQLS